MEDRPKAVNAVNALRRPRAGMSRAAMARMEAASVRQAAMRAGSTVGIVFMRFTSDSPARASRQVRPGGGVARRDKSTSGTLIGRGEAPTSRKQVDG
jgi:hypothetical protein